MIINPGSTHTDVADGNALIDMADQPTPGTEVTSLNNNPTAVVTDEE